MCGVALEVSQDSTIKRCKKGAARLTGCSFYFCLFLRYRKISVFTNHAVAIAVIPKIAFIDQLYAKVADLDAMAVAAAPAVKTVNATLIPAATAVTRLCSLARK